MCRNTLESVSDHLGDVKLIKDGDDMRAAARLCNDMQVEGARVCEALLTCMVLEAVVRVCVRLAAMLLHVMGPHCTLVQMLRLASGILAWLRPGFTSCREFGRAIQENMLALFKGINKTNETSERTDV